MSLDPTAAQEEFQDLLDKNTEKDTSHHPEDLEEARREAEQSDEDEEDQYRDQQIDAAMRMPTAKTANNGGSLKLPPASFDSGCSTGVKGVIADARAYQEARESRWRSKVRAARRSVLGLRGEGKESSDDEAPHGQDEEDFLQKWRETRRQELENELRANRTNRRTSPSLRRWGRLDTVDALGYLDAIERVGRDTVVVVYVYDHEGEVSAVIESALRPLVTAHPFVHFVKVHYEDIEFDNAAVPTILAYRNQGDLFANLTGIIEMIPDDEDFDSDSLKKLLRRHNIL